MLNFWRNSKQLPPSHKLTPVHVCVKWPAGAPFTVSAFYVAGRFGLFRTADQKPDGTWEVEFIDDYTDHVTHWKMRRGASMPVTFRMQRLAFKAQQALAELADLRFGIEDRAERAMKRGYGK